MKKFQESYKAHDAGYKTDPKYYTPEEILRRTENDFYKSGYETAIQITKDLPLVHIDLGSGVGWLVNKTSVYFKKCYAIEPSASAMEYSKNLNKNLTNIEHVNMSMLEGYNSIKPQEPIFITTGAVFSHIQDAYVEKVLEDINKAPNGSVLFFSENYNKNYKQNLWYIRNEYWWRKHLSNWFLLFFNLDTSGYPSGIYGIKMNHPENSKPDNLWYCYWFLDRLINFIKSLIKKINFL